MGSQAAPFDLTLSDSEWLSFNFTSRSLFIYLIHLTKTCSFDCNEKKRTGVIHH